jgi:cytochrome c556
MRSSLKLMALGAVLALVAAGALAADKDQVIKDRQALMKEQGADMGSVKAYLDDKADQAKATAGATDLVETMQKLPDLFPPGTEGPNPEGKYAPKPEVWSDWKGFIAVRDTGVATSQALLAAVKEGDKAKIQTAFADVGKNACGACHEKYRGEIKQ